MAKKTTKHKSIRERVTATEVAARQEAAQIRRLRDQQRRITDLSRALTRAVKTADVARLNAARALCEDTGYVVYGVEQIDAITKSNESLREENESQHNQIMTQAHTIGDQNAKIAMLENVLRSELPSAPAGSEP